MFRILWRLLTPVERSRAAFLVVLILGQGFVEALGLGSVLPLVSIVASPEESLKNRWISGFHDFLGRPELGAFILICCGTLLALFLLKNIYILSSDFLQASFSHSVQRRLSVEVLKGYLSRKLPFFFTANSSILLRHTTNEVVNVGQGILSYGLILVSELVTVTFIIGLMFAVNPELSVSLLLGLGGAVGFIYLMIRRKARRYGEMAYAATNQLFRIASEALHGVKDLKVLGRTDHYVERFREAGVMNSTYAIKARVLANIPRTILEMAAVGGVLGIVGYAATQPDGLRKVIPLLGLYAVSAYRLIPSANRIVSALTNFRMFRPSVKVVSEALRNEDSDPVPGPDGPRLELADQIDFAGISYQYKAGIYALKGVSFQIRKGESVGLVGPSGAGKSTAADIFLGLLEPGEGKILVDGRELQGERVPSWQKNIGYVPQHIFLADDSILQNVAFGIPSGKIDRGNVLRALEMAQLKEFVSALPEGLETRVGERGVQLSGGQRQRIGIARALYHDPEVLVLDEATSALDGATESQFNEAVKALAGKKTILIIAHRLSTIRHCDRILVFSGGNVVSEGRFEDLMKDSTEFRSLANHQGAGAGAE